MSEAAGSPAEEAIPGAIAVVPPAAPSSGPAGGDVWEVVAVLAVGVFPATASALAAAFDPQPRLPPQLWLDAPHFTVNSICVAFVVVYLIYRSGEPPSRFGLVRPRLSDCLFLGPALLLLMRLVWALRWLAFSPLDLDHPVGVSARPGGLSDYVWVVLMEVANAFSEELITRAYLITRIEELLKSRVAAVLLAAALFSSYHAYQGIDGLTTAFAVGLALGTAYVFLPRLWPFVFAHASYNIWMDLT